MNQVETFPRAAKIFVPPRPRPPDHRLRWFEAVAALRTNALGLWTKEAYENDILAGKFLGRPNFILNAPEAIHRVLVENTANYRRTPAAIRILRPIIGKGLFLSEGEAWRHQRRTVAPALAPRVIPLLARHIAGLAHKAAARLAEASHEPIDLLAAIQLLTLEIAAGTMFSLEMDRHGSALRGFITRFAKNLGRPHLLDLILPPAIPTLRDIARLQFRGPWRKFMDDLIAERLAAPSGDGPRDLFDLLVAARD